MNVERVSLDTWGEVLPDDGFEVFHTPAALGVLDDHTDADLQLYACYKGEKPVGLIPLFVDERAVGRAIYSPPPSAGVSRLGPIFLSNSPKSRKRESDNADFVEELLAELGVESRTTLFRIVCPLGYADPRPFAWAGLNVEPRFTYVLDLASRDREDVLDSYTRDLRTEIRKRDEVDVDVTVEGRDAAERVYDHVAERYAEQGESVSFTRAFVGDLVEALGERARTYVARDPDGEYLSGIVVLYANDHASFWQGGVWTDYESVSVNSLLHWEIVTDLLDGDPVEGVTGYDLVGANYRRLSRYKSKFSGDLAPYYAVESSGAEMALAKKAFDLVAK